MSMPNPSLNWEILDNVYYRSRICYENINWPLERSIDQYRVSIGPFSSLLAFYPKQNTILSQSDSIFICSSSGVLQYEITWNFSKHSILDVGWLNNGMLIIVLRNGTYRVYYNYNGDFEEFHLNDYIYDIGEITDCKFYRFGFAVRTNKNSLVYVQNPLKITKNSILVLDQLKNHDIVVYGWSLVLPYDASPTSLRNLTFLVFTSNGVCKLSSSNQLTFSHSDMLNNIKLFDISSNNNFIAIITNERMLYIFDNQFENILLKLNVDDNFHHLSDMKWCSNDVIVCSYQDYIKIYGPSSNFLTIYTSSKCYLYSEIDGIYYLTSENLNFFSKVDKITEETFKIGSSSSSSILFNSISLLDKHSPRANKNLEMISNDLVHAVDNCIRTAGNEFDLYYQKNLLRAAAFGKINLQLYDPAEYIQTCDYLRILNLIRSSEIGLFVTYDQLIFNGINLIIDLLLLKNLHYLCLKIADFLNLPKYKILNHWAMTKLKTSRHVNDNEMFDTIVSKLAENNIDWLQISKIAYEEGRLDLSKRFLAFEPDTIKKTEFLLNLNTSEVEFDYLISKSDEDGDVDSILLILLELLDRNSTSSEICKLINDKISIVGLLKTSVSQINLNLLKNYLYQDDDFISMLLVEIYKAQKIDENTIKLLLNISNKSKDLGYSSLSLNNLRTTISLQTQLKQEYDEIVVGEPSLRSLEKIINSDVQKAKSYMKKFNVSTVQFSKSVLNTLSKNKSKFDELYEFSLSNHGGKLIGFEEFYYTFFRLKEFRQAGLYLSLCNKMTPREKVKNYINCGMWKEAVKQASSSKDVELLKMMRDSKTGWESKFAADELAKLST